MKKLTYIISAISVLLATSCTNELETRVQDGKLSFSSINASMADLPTSRAHLEGGGKVVWDVNDNIGIYSDTQTTPVMFTCNNVDETKATFTSDSEVSGSNFVAYYPYGGATIDGNTMTYYLSNHEEYKPGSYARLCPMIAKSSSNEFRFKHTCGIIRFSMTGTKKVESLQLNGNNYEIINGEGTIDLSSDSPTLVIPNGGQSTIMTTNNLQLTSTPTDFYFIVPSGEFSNGLTLTINYLNEDSTITTVKKMTTQNVTVQRSVMKTFSVFDADELVPEEDRIFEALMAFYNATGGDNWNNNTNWGSDKPFNEWYGVTYDNENVTGLNLEGNNLKGAMTNELDELTELRNLYLDDNELTALNVGKNTKLSFLSCRNNLIESLDLTNNPNLIDLRCGYNKLTKLELSNHSALEYIECQYNQIPELNITKCPNLSGLICMNNNLTSLDVTQCTALKNMNCEDNNIANLDVTKCTELTGLVCYNNKLKSLNLSQCEKLTYLLCGNNDLSDIDVSNCKDLYYFGCDSNKISILDISKNEKLENIYCQYNQISTIEVSHLTNLKELWCADNNISELDVTKNKALEFFSCRGNNISVIDVTNNTELICLECSATPITSLDLCKNVQLERLYCNRMPNLTSLDVSPCSDLVFLCVEKSPNLSIVYISQEQTIPTIIADPHTQIYTIGGENDIYTSTDFSKDGEVSILQQASVGNGIDIVLMGDAYSDRLIADGTYDNTMNTAMEKFFSVEPYKSHRNMFNVYSVKAVSKNEKYYIGTETAFSGYFGSGTEVGGNDQQAFNYALKAISEERMDEALVIVMMNSTNYAGTCYMYLSDAGDYGNGTSVSYFPVGTDETALEQVLHHEAGGHGFAKLGDEYAYEENGAVPESEITEANTFAAYGWWKNVDFTNDPNNVKWSKFLSDSRYANDGLGIYEGAYTYWTGAYRPSENSIMRYNTGGFNAPSREAIYYRIHKLAYGKDWQYDYEKFVEYDAINRNTTSARSIERSVYYKPLHAPIVKHHSWKDAK